ncbi:MAG: hypothetical protein LUD19_03945 [Clostridia bacterium]|nr:hypothetical protein [Clostridia bacterium]
MADGVKGEINGIAEIYATFKTQYDEVYIDVNGLGGEMSYMTVKNCWYISFSCSGFGKDTLAAELTLNGNEREYTLVSVLSDGVMSGQSALSCVIEYDGDAFTSLTENGIFCGEIYIRLLYDDKCYYYVGVCDRSGNIKAYLTDGETGRVIAEHSYTA